MNPNSFQFKENILQFFSVHDDIWKKLQEFYYGQSPINEALAQLNKEDMSLFFEALSKNPARMMEMQWSWWQGQIQIYQNVLMRSVAKDVAPFIQPESGDRRFNSPLWQEHPNFDLLSQSYLLFSQLVQNMVDVVEGVPDKVRYRIHFFTRQMINALSPSNFLWTNPEVIQQTVAEQGENLVRGMQVFHDDVMNSGKYLSIRMVNSDSFSLGKDLAYTPGAVVFENDIFQLLQYEATTENVYQTPILVVPPFINKYYVLDLREQNSLVNWLRQQGHTVFLMSWRNPNAEQKELTFADLITQGSVEALRVIEEITGEKEANCIGYCIGGTLLAATQAYYVAKRLKNHVKSATYMATIIDFENPGSLGVFINEPVVSGLENLNNQLGYFDGRQLAVTFSLLRENTLYWNYYIDNYLKGKEPSDFDILYWNSDGTNIPAKIHNFLLRNLYLNNELISPNAVKVNGVGLNLSRVKTPSFFIATQEDHIALWDTCFRGADYLGGESTLVLGESGHVAGIVNPPSRNKYGCYTNAAKFENTKQWLDGAEYHPESWWLRWQAWVTPYTGEQVPARNLGNAQYPSIEAAPGRYVLVNLF
ncbi:MAG: class I poly(R)-hydroxyalkanoic acid synthase [Acinetobacter sp.]|uniref:Class I poly(R)-hydroxyalkanoic acid synthase n=2 Tax=Acinetobacter TaxID=469 RepID=A0A498CRY3_9GAMM|nr:MULTISPECIES: class I poly(R)-hydroxyalkanoic acid synthase [Acinetobacter]KRJ29869.1 poly(3-hydroxyalkanoate) synthetase [Acinetobacter baumannii]AAA52191.1 PHA synthase [Acinetobacter sp.]AAA99474.1 polyhydroxyalkanoic acid synthase [Acinetobacter sp.]MBC6676309.1 class I poly(R)-hydroxyalkanoic acid synthase [Acinetobacter sp.]MBP9788011.1 class I poly(R)-hydroxyalkanoic acid synthase [Acinetobacter sp.]